MSTEYRTTHDIVIPAGTKVGIAPRRVSHGTEHGEVVIGFDKDTTGALYFDLEEAERAGTIQKCDAWAKPKGSNPGYTARKKKS